MPTKISLILLHIFVAGLIGLSVFMAVIVQFEPTFYLPIKILFSGAFILVAFFGVSTFRKVRELWCLVFPKEKV